MCLFLFGSLTKAQNLKNTSPNPQKSPYSYRVCADALTAWMKDPARDAQTAWRDALDIPGGMSFIPPSRLGNLEMPSKRSGVCF